MTFLFADFAPEIHAVPVDEGIKARPYQQEAIDAVFREWESVPATLVVLPTGTGKSVVFAKVLSRWLRERDGRVMILAHRKELIVQAQEHARAAGATCDIEMAENRAGKKAKVIAASVQTLNSSAQCYDCQNVSPEQCQTCGGSGKLKRMTIFDPRDFGLIITDEGHHATANSYRDVYTWFAKNPHSRRLFVTATPERSDKCGLHNVADTVAYEMDLPTACAEGWLCVPRQQFIEVQGLNLANVSSKRGDLAEGELERVFLGENDEEQERLLHAIVRPVLDIAKNQQFILFATGVQHAKLLQAAFNAYRGTQLEARVETLLGSTEPFERADIVRRLKTGETQGLVNVGVATEGFDCPAVAVVAIARPTKSKSLYLQMIGRGTRPLPGIVDGPPTAEERLQAIANSAKPFCTVLDFVGNSGRHKLVSVADCLAGSKADPRDLETAIRMARRDQQSHNMEELVEQAKQAREAKELAAAKQRNTSTHRLATDVDMQAVAVPLFEGPKFNAYTDYRPQNPDSATVKQVALLTKLGVPPERATTTSKRQAGKMIDALTSRGGGEYIVTFGQHAGKPLKSIPSEYLQWMQRTLASRPEVMRHINDFLSQNRPGRVVATATDEVPF